LILTVFVVVQINVTSLGSNRNPNLLKLLLSHSDALSEQGSMHSRLMGRVRAFEFVDHARALLLKAPEEQRLHTFGQSEVTVDDRSKVRLGFV
tara:strand:- start:193 stop:471 length:279 start_codon:yes stop_codon:yes gene_type:complete